MKTMFNKLSARVIASFLLIALLMAAQTVPTAALSSGSDSSLPFKTEAVFLEEDNTIRGLSEKTSPAFFRSLLALHAGSRVKTAEGKGKADGYICTGDKVEIAGIDESYTFIIKGDLTCDGKANAADYMCLKRHVLGTFKLEGDALKAADIDSNGTVNAVDYLCLKRYVLGTFDIYDKSVMDDTTASCEHLFMDFFIFRPTDTERGEFQNFCSRCNAVVSKELYSNEEYAEMIRPYLLKYINQYRKAAGLHEVKLTQRRTEYSQYRAWQLTKNFSHAGSPEAAEATHCGYLSGDCWYDGEFFKGGWSGSTTEIITSTDSQTWGKYMAVGECNANTLDAFAKYTIDKFYNSTLGHKQIMLSDHDYYLGIGYYNGKICINFDIHNSDEINYSYDWQDENGKTHLKNIRDHKDENGNWIIDWEEQVL